MPGMTREIAPKSPLYKKVVARLSSQIKMAENEHKKRHDKWRKAEEAVLAYLPETQADRNRNTRRDAGEPTYTTIMVPYTYGIVMTIHTYLTSVFLGRTPVHQYVGYHGETEQQTQALEALIDSQVQGGEMLAPYYIWIYDAIKYGVGIVNEYWEDQTIQFSMVEEVPDELNPGKFRKIQTTRQIPGYKGNKIANVSPYDFLPDPRVTTMNFQRGEFCGVRKEVMWADMVSRARQGYYMNLDLVKSTPRWTGSESGSDGSALERPNMWLTEDIDEKGVERKHPAVVRLYEWYVNVIPKEWGLGESTYPEKWVFTITSDRNTLIGAQPLGSMHGQFPFGVLESEIEAYGAWNRGQPEIVEGMQQTMDWLLNSHFWNVRQTLNNQFIIDPSRVTMKDVAKGGAGFVWRARPEAYGSDMRTAVHQVPVMDVTRAHIPDMQMMFELGERTLGVNEAMMGVMASGGRKTATEIRTSTGFGVNRLKTIAEFMSAGSFSGHSTRLVMNSQQYYNQEEKLRRVGDLVLNAGPTFIEVNPQLIAGRYQFVPVDGTLPADRFAQATLWKDILAQITRIPQIAMSYDLGKIFAYIAQLVGLKNINQFKVQMGDPAQLAALAQAGNVVPISPGKSSTMAGVAAADSTPAATGAY